MCSSIAVASCALNLACALSCDYGMWVSCALLRHVLCGDVMRFEIWHVLWLGVFIGAERRRGLLIHCAASCALLRHVLCVVV